MNVRGHKRPKYSVLDAAAHLALCVTLYYRVVVGGDKTSR